MKAFFKIRVTSDEAMNLLNSVVKKGARQCNNLSLAMLEFDPGNSVCSVPSLLNV